METTEISPSVANIPMPARSTRARDAHPRRGRILSLNRAQSFLHTVEGFDGVGLCGRKCVLGLLLCGRGRGRGEALQHGLVSGGGAAGEGLQRRGHFWKVLGGKGGRGWGEQENELGSLCHAATRLHCLGHLLLSRLFRCYLILFRSILFLPIQLPSFSSNGLWISSQRPAPSRQLVDKKKNGRYNYLW